jgi:formylglycine-generating enzyme required for sulfatase activity
MPSRGRRVAIYAAVGLGVTALAAIAIRFAAAPARCPEGAVALGARCCGEGQREQANACLGRPSRCPGELEIRDGGCVAPVRTVRLEGGAVELNPADWVRADGAAPTGPARVEVGAFRIDAFEVTLDRWRACEAAGRCAPVQGVEPGLPAHGVSFEAASAYCEFAGGALPTPSQLILAAAGRDGRRFPWGPTGAVCRRGAWGLVDGPCGHGATGPDVTGVHPDGSTPEGIADLAGNVAEWTRPEEHAGGIASAPALHGGSYADASANTLRSFAFRSAAAAPPADAGVRCVYAP